jgi:hypothetical protein
MAGRNLSQVVGEIGEYMVSYMIVKTKNWVARLQQMDYGVDTGHQTAGQGVYTQAAELHCAGRSGHCGCGVVIRRL